MNDLKAWFGQVTTGHGAMILAPTVLGVLSGQMTWIQATPLLVAGIVGLLWPENAELKASATALTGDLLKFEPAMQSDIGAVTSAYLTGVQHGNAAAQPAHPAAAAIPTPA